MKPRFTGVTADRNDKEAERRRKALRTNRKHNPRNSDKRTGDYMEERVPPYSG